jgi:hypothetical protein
LQAKGPGPLNIRPREHGLNGDLEIRRHL